MGSIFICVFNRIINNDHSTVVMYGDFFNFYIFNGVKIAKYDFRKKLFILDLLMHMIMIKDNANIKINKHGKT